MKTKKPTPEQVRDRENARLVRYYDNTRQRQLEIQAKVRDENGLKVDRYIKNLYANVPGVSFTANGDVTSGVRRSSNAQRRKAGNKAMKKWWDECGRWLAAKRENEEGMKRGISVQLTYPIPERGCVDANESRASS